MEHQSIKTVILCGGEGLRFRNDVITDNKILAPISGFPVLWHIMNHYATYGFKTFILCVRDDDDVINQYVNLQNFDWEVTVIRTGNDTSTGGRIKKIKEFINEDEFFVTYGDGLSDINLAELFSYHLLHNKLATLTAVKPMNQYGVLQIEEDGQVSSFEEKPKMKEWVNGGFFVFNKKILNLLDENDSLEQSLIDKLVPKNELIAYRFEGFWKSIDTFKDYLSVLQIFKEIPQ